MDELKDKEYKRFEEIKYIREDGTEFWSARELAIALDYTKWENFSKVIGRAMIACYLIVQNGDPRQMVDMFPTKESKNI